MPSDETQTILSPCDDPLWMPCPNSNEADLELRSKSVGCYHKMKCPTMDEQEGNIEDEFD